VKGLAVLAAAVASISPAQVAYGQSTITGNAAETAAPADPGPSDMSPSSSEPDLSFAAVPLTSFSSDVGLGLGLRGVVQRTTEGTPPYRWSLEAQGFATTAGTQFHYVSFDVPHIAGTGIRIDGLAGYYRNQAAPYYGIGDHPAPSDAEPASYYSYLEEVPLARGRLRVPVIGSLSAAVAYRFLSQGVTAGQGSLLARDAPLGATGGPYGEASAGLALDTRDDEMSTTEGVLLEITGRTTGAALGSRYVSGGAFASAAVFKSIVRRLVVATRLAADVTWGEVPFDRMQDFGSIVTPFAIVSGVGGALTVRGLRQSEYIAPIKAIANAEIRWQFAQLRVWQHDVRLTSVSFIDGGEVWGAGDSIRSFPRGLHGAFGEGLRIAWGKLVLLRGDAGYGEGDVRLYADFRNVF
jgi:hypothetical protein